MSADTLVAIIGLAMALLLVGANGALQRLPRQRMLRMVGIWIILIGAAVAVFSFVRL